MPYRFTDEPVKKLGGSQVVPGSDADFSANRLAINLIRGTKEILIEAVAASRVGCTPKILEAYWYDDSADVWVDLLAPDSAILHSDQTGVAAFTLAVADYLYIRTSDRVGGFFFDLDATLINNNSAVVAFAYLGPGGAWVPLAGTNGTVSGGAMFAQDGLITLDTVPSETAWINAELSGALPHSLPAGGGGKGHWCRISASAALDTVEIEQLQTLIPDIGGDGDLDSRTIDMMFAKAGQEYSIPISEEVGSLEFIAQVASATTMNITWVVW